MHTGNWKAWKENEKARETLRVTSKCNKNNESSESKISKDEDLLYIKKTSIYDHSRYRVSMIQTMITIKVHLRGRERMSCVFMTTPRNSNMN